MDLNDPEAQESCESLQKLVGLSVLGILTIVGGLALMVALL